MSRQCFTLLLILLSVSCTCPQAQCTIIVNSVPENTPPGDNLYVAGDFQGWNPGSPDHQLSPGVSAGSYTIFLPSVSGTINFKFTRGNWPTVEGDANGGVITNRNATVQAGDTLYFDILGWEDLSGSGSGNSTAVENVSLLSGNFYLPQLDRQRRIWLYLPPDYATSTTDYPVLYMHDGQNVFDATTAFAGEWEVDETLNALFAEGDPGIIVVAIDNGGASRTDEYCPWNNPTYGGGEGMAYVDFIAQTLKPYIDENYRTKPSAEHTGLMGSSLGGLISLYGGIRYPEVFGRIGAFSPAYWINNPEIFDFVTATGQQPPQRIYQIGGDLEGGNVVGLMNQMQNTLLQAGFPSETVRSVSVADGEHAEWFWRREFAAAYQWLFRSEVTSVLHHDPELASVRFFPNPTTDVLNVALTLADAHVVQLELMDLQGRLLDTLSYQELSAGDHIFDIELNKLNLSNGKYYMTIKIGEKKFCQMIFYVE